MTASNFPLALSFTLSVEQGFQCDPNDPGNYLSGSVGNGAPIGTNMGITPRTLQSWLNQPVTRADMECLSVPVVSRIYRDLYWMKIDANDLPSGLDLMEFDHAVNAGVGADTSMHHALALLNMDQRARSVSSLQTRTIRLIQSAAGVTADGIVGPDTRAALEENEPLLNIACTAALQLADYKRKSNWLTYRGAWLDRLHGRTKAAIRLLGVDA